MYVKTPEGWLVDPETGEVVSEEEAVVIDEPEYRAYDYFERIEREHYYPIRTSKASKSEARRRILEKGGALELLPKREQRKAVREGLIENVYESSVLELGGIRALAIFRALKAMCMWSVTACYNAVVAAWQGRICGGEPYRIARSLKSRIEWSYGNATCNWIAKSKKQIDLDHALTALRGRTNPRNPVPCVHAELDGFSLRITRRKVDISGKLRAADKVVDLLAKLSDRLGVEFTNYELATMTYKLELPFPVAVGALRKAGAIIQGGMARAKLNGSFYTALVHKHVLLIFLRKQPPEKIDTALLELLPKISEAHMYRL